jgi:hypothetical protein
METVARLIAVLLLGLMMLAGFSVFKKLANQAVSDRRYNFTDEEIARGEHCREKFLYEGGDLIRVLNERMGDNLDDRVNLSVRKIELGPLRLDGTHRLVVLYNINRIGETVGPAKKATGKVVNADCSVTINVFQN